MQTAATQMAETLGNLRAQPIRDIRHPKQKQSYCISGSPSVQREVPTTNAFLPFVGGCVLHTVRSCAFRGTTDTHSFAQEKQVHAGTTVESRRRSRAEEA